MNSTMETHKKRLRAQRRQQQMKRAKDRFHANLQSEPGGWIKLLVICLVLAGLGLFLPEIRAQADQLVPNVYVEFVGLIFDILFIGLLFGWGARARERRQAIQRYGEEIDDFKKWDSTEAKCRIAGNIRRLNKLGLTAIDLGGLEISDFSFVMHDIRSIAGSTFYDGEWGTGSGRERTRLARVSFDRTDCTDVTFSPFWPLPRFIGANPFIKLQDCSFVTAMLKGARFDGAHMVWTETPPEGIYETERTDDGEVFHYQTYYPPFHDVDLTGVSFRDVEFKNADFRRAENLSAADFTGASGLETCAFDASDAQLLRERGLLSTEG